MQGQDAYQIRVMQPGEVKLAVDWANLEGWNPGLNDAACFMSADRSGFYVGLLEDKPVAVISAVKYGTTFGFVGLYIVHPEYRGLGYGWKIWQHAIGTLSGRNIGLDGVVAQQENYKKSGFQLAYRNIRFEGQSVQETVDRGVVNLQELPLELICELDRRYFPEERGLFLKDWISQPDAISLGIVEQGKLAGYGVLRPCQVGYKVGPLFAKGENVAEQILLALMSRVPEKSTIYLDIPETNPAALKLVEKYRMSMVFETARMYTSASPQIDLQGIYGVTTFELG